MHNTLRLLASAAFTLLLLAPAQAGAIADGGFESPATGGFTNYSAPSAVDAWSVTSGTIELDSSGINGVSHSGSQMAYLDYGYGVNTISQSLATVVGQQYQISFWLADNAANQVTADFGGTTGFSGGAPTNGVSSASDYVMKSFLATATSSNTLLSFSGQYTKGDNGTLLDDVSVDPVNSSVPEPITISLFGAGLAGIAATRRRRKVSKTT